MGRKIVAAVILFWGIPVSILVNRIVPEEYMDETFHIQQAQCYCNGDFKSWDPMITTPPGLYYFSLVYVAPISWGLWCLNSTTSFSEMCSVAVLRSVNVFLSIICGLIVYDIFVYVRPTLSERRITLYTIVLALYPIHWFFSFLYYTDIASTTAVLFMYLASLKKHYWLSALLGGLATFVRQTNIIWMLFVAGISIIDIVRTLDKMHGIQSTYNGMLYGKKKVPGTSNKSHSINLRKRKIIYSTKVTGAYSAPRSTAKNCSPYFVSGLISEIWQILSVICNHKFNFFVSFAPFLLILVGFTLFVISNGSIVLGAKEAHMVSLHFPQMFYFGLICAAAMGPFHLSLNLPASLLKLCRANKLLFFALILVGISAGMISVHYFSIAHPYLLADNRHYTFYIWRRIVNAYWLNPYFLVPIYLYSWAMIISILKRGQRAIWILLFFFACMAVLVPTPLVEFRYYTLPFLFVALHSHADDDWSWCIMGAAYMIVNIFSMGIFLYKPFHWKHEPGVQRFIW